VPAVTVGLSASLTAPGPARDYVCDAATVGEALRALADQAPQLAPRVFYGDRLLVVVALNGRRLSPPGVRETALAAGDRLDLLVPVAGG
jgi:molybdopterin converting factor small subunit